MNNDDLKAWLLLAGFRYSLIQDGYIYGSTYDIRIIVSFRWMKYVAVYSNGVDLEFTDRRKAQQYIQSIIGD